MVADIFEIREAPGPVIATAIHAGHGMRDEIRSCCALDPSTRMREEDPFTDLIADIGVTIVRVMTSRFEVDLNRPRDRAVYQDDSDAWGLVPWRTRPTPEQIERSLAEYDLFYSAVNELLTGVIERWGCALVLDVHSYNHRRGGPVAQPDDPATHPEINLGTGTITDAARWLPVTDAVRREFEIAGFDARENVKFKGGAFPAWVNSGFDGRACAVAIEFKKTFVDEWTGEVDPDALERARLTLARVASAGSDALREVCT